MTTYKILTMLMILATPARENKSQSFTPMVPSLFYFSTKKKSLNLTGRTQMESTVTLDA